MHDETVDDRCIAFPVAPVFQVQFDIFGLCCAESEFPHAAGAGRIGGLIAIVFQFQMPCVLDCPTVAGAGIFFEPNRQQIADSDTDAASIVLLIQNHVDFPLA